MMKYNNLIVTAQHISSRMRKIVSFSAIALMLVPSMSFARVKHSKQTNAQARAKYKQRHSAEDDALFADGIKIKRDLFLIDKAQMERAYRADAVPADKLYGQVWNNTNLRCYRSVENVPDSFTVNLRGFSMPTMGRITSNFGPRGHRHHEGIDLKVNTGDTIYAAFDGKVRIKQYDGGGYGYYLTIRHPNGLETLYGHLSRFLVDENQNVKSGQPIALGGSTGHSTASHLHFETRFIGRPIDPSRIIDFDNKVCHRDYYVVNSNSFSPAHSQSTDFFTQYKGNSDNKYTRGAVRYHRVSKGDTLAEIAQKNGTTIKKICSLNRITKRTKLRPGKTLRIG